MQRVSAPKSKKSNGLKKAKRANVNIRQATSSLSKPAEERVRSVPAAMGSMKISGRPKITQSGAIGDSRIIHREYLGEVDLTTLFTSKKYPINVGQVKTFPWLSQIAKRYESYRFNRLKFSYETACSSAQVGTVMLVPDYDCTDIAPVSKVQALSYRNSARAQPWLSFCQTSAAEDLNKQKSYFVRATSSGVQPRLSDVGNMFLCTQGATQPGVGELWVEYDVHLMTPQMGNIELFGAEKIVSGGTISAGAPLGDAPVLSGDVDLSVDPVGPNLITFNQDYQGLLISEAIGTVLVSFGAGGTAATSTVSYVVDAAGTKAVFATAIDAKAGQTLSIDWSTSATLTSSIIRMGAYIFALG